MITNITTAAKMKWLENNGYKITELTNEAGIIATCDSAEITISFTPDKMEVQAPKAFYALEGWQKIELQAFIIIAHAFQIVPMTDEEKTHCAHMMEHYGVTLLNQLS